MWYYTIEKCIKLVMARKINEFKQKQHPSRCIIVISHPYLLVDTPGTPNTPDYQGILGRYPDLQNSNIQPRRWNSAELGAGSIESNEVGASIEIAADLSRSSKSLDALGHSGRGAEILLDLKVKSKTSNMRAGHRGARHDLDGLRGPDTSRLDAVTRCHDVNLRSWIWLAIITAICNNGN